jgi:hypothetical protein
MIVWITIHHYHPDWIQHDMPLQTKWQHLTPLENLKVEMIFLARKQT